MSGTWNKGEGSQRRRYAQDMGHPLWQALIVGFLLSEQILRLTGGVSLATTRFYDDQTGNGRAKVVRVAPSGRA